MPIPDPQAQQPTQAPTPAQLPQPFSGVAAGDIPAIRFPSEGKAPSSPLAAWAASNLDAVARAGIAFLETPKKESIFYNPVKVDRKTLEAQVAKGDLKHIPEIKALAAPKSSLADAKTRTVHKAPVSSPVQAQAAPAGGPPVASVQAPVNSANAPVGPGGANPPAPDSGPVKIDKKLMGQRISALKNEDVDGSKLPGTVLSKLSKRAI